MAIDVDKVSSFSEILHDWWKVPLQVILALLILYRNLGFASLATLVATVLVMLANFPLGKIQKRLQGKLMESKDDRMKATSEILRNMKILKLQGWEMKFLSKIVALRENEEGWLRKYTYARTVGTFIFFLSPTVVAAVTFAACIVVGIPLESGKVLSAIATFGMLREAIFDLPHLISMLAQAKVSLDRISSFLRLEDLQPDMIIKLPSTSKVAVEIVNGNFSWDLSSSNTPTLKDVNFHVFRGMKVGVCGTVGSGKSSLLSCILGEMVKLSGDIKLCGTKAYVSQSPWIQSGKIEENILFGKVMDRERYERVIEACSLRRDIDMLPFGDQTIIGERGINLSGGQKQRIQIARALYQDADLYLLDDPFSALDAHTGMHVYKECLHMFLDSKTVIYTTNQVEFLPSADLIMVLKDGRITQSGKYNEILTPGTDFMELVGAHKKALLIHRNSSAETGALASETVEKFDQEKGNAEEDKKQMCRNTSTIDEELLENQAQLVQDEEREKGRVGFKVYMNYITTAYKGALVPVILLLQIVAQVLQIGSDYWIASNTPVSKDVKSPIESSTLIYIYAGLALGSCIFVFGRAISIGTVGYKTATILFKRMHMCIFRAPMSFFDATPSGRILNRASSDQNAVDYEIPLTMGALAMNGIRLVGVVVVMAHGGWQVIIIYIPVAGLCIWYQ
ncbi:ABC transporter ATP-binding protein/permease VMR1, partial [Thalictrum thalictroides]